MGFQLDIYILTEKSDKTVVNFIKKYCGYEYFNNFKKLEIFLRKSNEVILLKSFSAFQKRYNDIYFDQGFSVYFKPIDTDYKAAILNFTNDGFLILGLSIVGYLDDKEEIPNYSGAQKVLNDLMAFSEFKTGYYIWETPPADTQIEFLKMKEEAAKLIP